LSPKSGAHPHPEPDPLISFAIRRVLTAIPLLLGVATIVFLVLSLAPGDPSAIYFGPGMSPETLEGIRRDLGLDDPIVVRYFRWLFSFARGDFGYSFASNMPVSRRILAALPNTLVLATVSLFLAFSVGILMGVVQAVRQYSLLDSALSGGALFFYSMPSFWLAIMLILVFSVNANEWGWPMVLPVSGVVGTDHDLLGPIARLGDRGKHLILPVLSLTLVLTAGVARYVRASMLEVIRQDYIRTARAKGLSEFRVIFKHGLRNGLIPVVTLFGLSFPFLLSGAVFIALSRPSLIQRSQPAGRLPFSGSMTAMPPSGQPHISSSTLMSSKVVSATGRKIVEPGMFEIMVGSSSAEEIKQSIELAVLPCNNVEMTFKKFYPLLHYLEQKTNINVRLVVPTNFAEFEASLKHGDIDFALQDPHTYLALSDLLEKTKLLGSLTMKGETAHSGVVIVKENSRVVDLADLRGKTVIFGPEASMSKWLAAIWLFKEAGLDIDRDLKAYVHGGCCEDIAFNVFLGAADAGVVCEHFLAEHEERQKDLGLESNRIIVVSRTRPVPTRIFAPRKGTPADIANKIHQTLINLDIKNPVHMKILHRAEMGGFKPANDADYEALRPLMGEWMADQRVPHHGRNGSGAQGE